MKGKAKILVEGTIYLDRSLFVKDANGEMVVEENNLKFKVTYTQSQSGRRLNCILELEDTLKCGRTIRVKGTAICHRDDKFDVGTGLTIAENRAVIKAYECMNEILIDLEGDC